MKAVSDTEANNIIRVNEIHEEQYIFAIIDNKKWRVLEVAGSWHCCNSENSKFIIKNDPGGATLQEYLRYLMIYGEVYAYDDLEGARNFFYNKK
jgi:hypothetical protein